MQISLFNDDKAHTIVVPEYSNFANVFFLKLAAERLDYTEINNHVINLMDSKYLFYKPIYSLGLIELEIFNIYIEIYLANNFIKLTKSPTYLLILLI